ncbi:MAG TPA: hypothetical protein VLZ81_01995 [Blastocatellia bacterium]|nr:hypothetical protein [Blastocatellia bacterium]
MLLLPYGANAGFCPYDSKMDPGVAGQLPGDVRTCFGDMTTSPSSRLTNL